jgi:hypothetical protein
MRIQGLGYMVECVESPPNTLYPLVEMWHAVNSAT